MELLAPNLDFERSYNEYIEELGDEERYPFPMNFDSSDFRALLEKLESFSTESGVPPGFVPATTYWLVEGSELLGVSNLRHYLNDTLRFSGGHIGLGIRPSYRGKGLGKLLLKETIGRASEMGVSEIHIHCEKDNTRSARMILSSGGVLESEVVDDDVILQRYIVHAT